jgi:hypothetical protein
MPADGQAVKPAPSSWHWKVTPACESLYAKLAEVWLVNSAGWEVMVGSVTVLAAAASVIQVASATSATTAARSERRENGPLPLVASLDRPHRIGKSPFRLPCRASFEVCASSASNYEKVKRRVEGER